MNKNHRFTAIFSLILSLGLGLGCLLPTVALTPTPTSLAILGTPTPGAIVKGGGSDSNSGLGNNSGGSNGSSNGGNGSSNGSNNGSSTEVTETPTPTATPPGPTPKGYVVKQIETLGGETISGAVCDLKQPFIVNSVTPKVSFTFLFTPQIVEKGNVSYRYSIPSAGESHDAKGTYTLAQIAPDGTMQLSLTVSDHVVFKGFDGNIPNRYKFNLVPTEGMTCPSAP